MTKIMVPTRYTPHSLERESGKDAIDLYNELSLHSQPLRDEFIEFSIRRLFDPEIIKKENSVRRKARRAEKRTGFPFTRILGDYLIKKGKKELIKRTDILVREKAYLNAWDQLPELYRNKLDVFSRKLDKWTELYEDMPENIRERCISCIDQIFQLDLNVGLEFVSNAAQLICSIVDVENKIVREKLESKDFCNRLYKSYVELGIDNGIDATKNYYFGEAITSAFYDGADLMERYADCIRSLIGRSKAPGARDYRPEGLLARMLDETLLESEGYANIILALQNSVFLNYLYEGRLPAYSWSASSGEEMMKALTTGEYRKGYDAERRLIDRVNRGIYIRQPFGK